MALALDEQKDSDDTFENGGVTYLINKELLSQVGGVKVDYLEQGWRSGFMVSSEKPVNNGGSACGTSCSC